jgi:hypothetical protein
MALVLAALIAFGLSMAGVHLPGLMEGMSVHHDHPDLGESHHHGDVDDQHDGPDSPCEHQAAHCCCAHVTAAEILDVSSSCGVPLSLRAPTPSVKPAMEPSDRSVLHIPIA